MKEIERERRDERIFFMKSMLEVPWRERFKTFSYVVYPKSQGLRSPMDSSQLVTFVLPMWEARVRTLSWTFGIRGYD